MNYKVVPFTGSGNSASSVATQLQALIDENSNQGWMFDSLNNIESNVAPENGCFGFGAKPGYTTSVQVAVFKK